MYAYIYVYTCTEEETEEERLRLQEQVEMSRKMEQVSVVLQCVAMCCSGFLLYCIALQFAAVVRVLIAVGF